MVGQGIVVYRDAAGRALRQWQRLLATHLTATALGSLALWPLIAAFQQRLIGFSSDAVISDFGIATFLLRPAGLLALLLIAASVLAVLVVETAAMMAIDMADRRGIPAGAWHALRFILRRVPGLLFFGLILSGRILAVLLPALAVSWAVAWALLTAHDINYYLSRHPPEFILAAVLIAATLLVAAIFLGRRLMRWSLALPLTLFARMRATTALARSSHLVRKRRPAIIRSLLVWAGASFALTAAVGAMFYIAADFLLPRFDASPRAQALLLGLGGILWVIIHAIALAWNNATFAITLNGLVLDADPLMMSEGRVPAPPPAAAGMEHPVGWIVAGLATFLLAAGSVGGAVRFVERLRMEDEVTVIAHRAGAGGAPENTMAAVERGIADGADWLEIDVQENADGTVVVIHDRDFMRLSGEPIEVRTSTDADAARLDIGGWSDPAYAGERLMTLPVMLRAARGRVKVLIELKDYGFGKSLEERVAGAVEAAGMADDIAIMSMSRARIDRMRALRPGWEIGLLTARAFGDMTRIGTDFLAVSTGMATTPLLLRAHQAGQKVYVWTVNDPGQMSDLIARGFDGLITDYPARAQEVLASRQSLSALDKLMLLAGSRLGLTD
jgi:glycerophosphoryl diester phosphodiesterase